MELKVPARPDLPAFRQEWPPFPANPEVRERFERRIRRKA
jgi:hypothetical protein